jgi:hypothetical protein
LTIVKAGVAYFAVDVAVFVPLTYVPVTVAVFVYVPGVEDAVIEETGAQISVSPGLKGYVQVQCVAGSAFPPASVGSATAIFENGRSPELYAINR